MILALLVALVINPEPSIPEMWTNVQELRLRRYEEIVCFGHECETSWLARVQAEYRLSSLIGGNPRPIRPGFVLANVWRIDGSSLCEIAE